MKTILQLLLIFLLLSCHEKYPYPNAVFPKEPVNLIEVNSVFDDVNSDLTQGITTHLTRLVFSTNRNSSGKEYDFVGKVLFFDWSEETGVLYLRVDERDERDNREFYDKVESLNTSCNEKGPYSYWEGGSTGIRYMLYSSDCKGNFQIRSKVFASDPSQTDARLGDVCFRISDGSANEMYPSFHGSKLIGNGDGVLTEEPEKLVFSSDEEGVFSIYGLTIPKNTNALEFLASDQTKQIQKLPINSSSNDHAPLVQGNLLVFASDRPGGYGGYDLYYSEYVGGQWAEPVNFGPKINSSSDEFRPVVSDGGMFANRLMIFSSDRPGGLGGFDLYYVGIPRF